MLSVLGLDLSLNETGYYQSDISGVLLGLIKSGNRKGLERLQFLRDSLNPILKAANPDVVVIEDYAMGIRGGKVFHIGEWGGLAKLTVYERGLPIMLVSPCTLKKFICGKGNAKKNEMMLAVYKRYGSDFSNDNLCDAFALAVFGLALHNETEYVKLYGALTQSQRSSLKVCIQIDSPKQEIRDRRRPK